MGLETTRWLRATLGDLNQMTRADISVIGISGGARPFRVAASATRFYAGEPLMRTPTYSSGATNANTVIVLTDTKPHVATDNFIGIASVDAQVNSAGTVIAHKTYAAVPIPGITRLRAKAKTATSIVDTDANLIAVLGDVIDFDLTAGVYTLDGTASSNASALEIVDGNVVKGTLDVTVDVRALRTAVS